MVAAFYIRQTEVLRADAEPGVAPRVEYVEHKAQLSHGGERQIFITATPILPDTMSMGAVRVGLRKGSVLCVQHAA